MAEPRNSDLDEALRAVEALVRIFRFERIVYLVIAVISALFFFYAGYQLLTENNDTEHLVALLGSSGVATAVCTRVMYIFSKCFAVVEAVILREQAPEATPEATP